MAIRLSKIKKTDKLISYDKDLGTLFKQGEIRIFQVSGAGKKGKKEPDPASEEVNFFVCTSTGVLR